MAPRSQYLAKHCIPQRLSGVNVSSRRQELDVWAGSQDLIWTRSPTRVWASPRISPRIAKPVSAN